jgi:hypothetical protein
MGSEIPSGGGTALLGMALIEHQQLLAREGKEARQMSHELGIAAKKIETIYTGLAKAQREFEETTAYISAAYSVVNLGMSASGVGSKVESQNQINAMPEGEQKIEAQRQFEDQALNPQKYESTKDKVTGMLEKGASAMFDESKRRMGETDEQNKKWAESFKEIGEVDLKLSEKIRKNNEKETELTADMLKVGSILKRVG